MSKQHKLPTAERVSPATVFARSTGDAIWRGVKQEKALAHLTDGRSLKLLLGPASSGKSMIMQLFGAEAADRTVFSCSGPQKTALGVLSSLLMGSELELCTMSENDQRTLLTAFIEHLSFCGKRIAICIDDVADFSDEAWAEIKRLTHLKSAGRPLIDLIISGTKQEASRLPLERLLRESTTSQVDAMHFLEPPNGRDLESYIAWRLERFGIPIRFNPDACAAIASKAAGRFGRVNLICQVALWDRDLTQPCEINGNEICAAEAKLAALKSPGSYPARRNPLRAGSDPRPTRNKDSVRLTIYLNDQKIRQLPLNGAVIIGRSQTCDVRLQSRLISRHHAIFTVDPDGAYFVSDLGSTNGVLVNGKYIKRKRIADGDVIDLSEFRIRVEVDGCPRIPAQDLKAVKDFDNDATATLEVLDLRKAEARSARLA